MATTASSTTTPPSASSATYTGRTRLRNRAPALPPLPLRGGALCDVRGGSGPPPRGCVGGAVAAARRLVGGWGDCLDCFRCVRTWVKPGGNALSRWHVSAATRGVILNAAPLSRANRGSVSCSPSPVGRTMAELQAEPPRKRQAPNRLGAKPRLVLGLAQWTRLCSPARLERPV